MSKTLPSFQRAFTSYVTGSLIQRVRASYIPRILHRLLIREKAFSRSLLRSGKPGIHPAQIKKKHIPTEHQLNLPDVS
jgi:hypothetical protein